MGPRILLGGGRGAALVAFAKFAWLEGEVDEMVLLEPRMTFGASASELATRSTRLFYEAACVRSSCSAVWVLTCPPFFLRVLQG